MMPLQLELSSIAVGPAVVVVGLLGLLLWAVVEFRNPAGVVMWGLTVTTLVMVSLFGVGAELFWLAVLATVLLVVVGVTVRLSRGGR